MSSYQAIPKAKDLLDYSMQRTQTKSSEADKAHFPKSQTFYYCKALRDAALAILEQVQAANDYYFETQFDDRLRALDTVMQKCELMLHLVDLSLKHGYITVDQCHYWTEQITGVKRPVFAWRKADGNRAAELRNAARAAEIAQIAAIVKQII
jgi:hypothetical protein